MTYIIMAVFAALIIIADQVTKLLTVANFLRLSPVVTISCLPPRCRLPVQGILLYFPYIPICYKVLKNFLNAVEK